MRRLTLLLLVGCAPPAGSTEPVGHTDPPVDTDLIDDTDHTFDDRCAPALELTASSLRAVPLGIVELQASGGTGAHRFTLLEPERGIGFVEASLGRLLVGDTPGVPHVVELTDDGCEGSAELTIEVVPNLSVTPSRATVLPGASFMLETAGGLGAPACTLLESLSGASLEGCTYTAGDADGLDRIEVIDEESGDRVVVRITVDANSRFGVAEEGWWIPLGGQHVVTPASGSGSFTVEPLEGEDIIRIEGDRVTARAAGRARVRIRDRFSDHAADVPIVVVPPHRPPLSATASGRTGRMIGQRDFDGDGYDDVLLALPEFDRDARDAGLIAVYRGGPSGPDPMPALELGPQLPEDSLLGYDVAVGDWNGDGEADLAVGAYELDAGTTNNGGVYLITSFMTTDPATALLAPSRVGDDGGDRFGSGVALCDFDGDGFQDLAVGAYSSEDGTPTGMGSITVYAGDGEGFDEEPTATRWGALPQQDGTWERGRVYLGLDLLAEDVDGDGRCDLLSSAWNASLDGAGQDGIVTLFRGVEHELIEETPSRMITWAGSHNTARIGRAIDLGHLDDDGLLDLVVGTYTLNGSRGQVHAFLGEDWLAEGPIVMTTDASTLYLEGDRGGDELGHALQLTDVDGDGIDDLLVSATGDEVEGAGRNDQGQVWLFDGGRLREVRGRGPHTPQSLKARAISPAGEGQFAGIVAGAAGDMDGDGVNEVFVHSLLDVDGAFAGQPEVVPLSEAPPYPLELEHGLNQPGTGTVMALADATGDGRSDVLVGAWTSADAGLGRDAGSLWSFARTAEGFSPWADEVERSYAGRAGGDRFARAATTQVDLDGDGWQDLVVVSERATRPSSFSEEHSPRTCGARTVRGGAVFVYKGGLRGFGGAPALVVHGPEREGYIEAVEPAGDFDGDGFEDVMVGSGRWGVGGGVWLLRGRALPDRGTTLVCMDAADRWLASEASAVLGRHMAALGDVDQDGCDDIAVGAYGQDRGRSNQGLVRILWGGGPGCNTRPAVSQLASGTNNAYAAERLAGGVDLTGDGVPDMLIGAPRYGNGAAGGVVWAVSGDSLRRLERTPITAGLPPATSLPAPRLDAVPDTLTLRETTPRARFGHGLGVLPDPDGGPGLAFIGRSAADGGGAFVYRLAGEDSVWEPDPLPVRVLAGEPDSGDLGEHAVCYPGNDTILVGAPTSGQHEGAVYALPITMRAEAP